MSIRLIATVLAIIATGWGLLVAGPFLWGLRAETIAITAPAYLMTAGYWARAVFDLPRGTRMAVWWLSLAVQGCWAIFGLYVLIYSGLDVGLILLLAWWWSATGFSAWSLWHEPPETPEWLAVWDSAEIPTSHG
ncbi:MAG TPA: hypothetical protein VFG20_13230 [Planctomycetaceae bacterium]|nr:hypothetical protein [Planctomycetaceae bacterium]